jgi:hypothetical protein
LVRENRIGSSGRKKTFFQKCEAQDWRTLERKSRIDQCSIEETAGRKGEKTLLKKNKKNLARIKN